MHACGKMCVCEDVDMCIVWVEVRGQLCGDVLFYFYLGSDLKQVTGVHSKSFYPLSHLHSWKLKSFYYNYLLSRLA